VRVRFEGSAGQSFGAFLTAGVELDLVGEANDYVGKSMSGGRMVISPPADDAGEPCLLGNTALYGASGGKLFCAGTAGERFAVRNSGAVAVVEGVGDHACEYMTAGTVVIIGPVGLNLGAGMTGGEVYVYDPAQSLSASLNGDFVQADVPDAGRLEEVRALLERHVRYTRSPLAAAVLDTWETASRAFTRVAPTTERALVEPADEPAVSAGAP
jgi:glutamate synthase domain-containing protein 3